ncbi:MAG: transposase, partial [Oscillospiraceae bacterium]|nr:transposase [Oscillospiraceae bacterium]
TYYNWLPQILTSLEYSYSNGYTEGCNNKIKVLKRNGYGYRNFEVFRKRILNAF